MRLKIPSLLTTFTFALLAGTTPLTAQWRTEPIPPLSQAPALTVDPPMLRLPDSLPSPPEDDGTLALAGVAGAAVGTLDGAYLHHANGGRGSLSAAYLSSALITGAGMAGLLAIGTPEGTLVVLGAPLAQVISAVLIERRVAQ